MKVKLIYRNYKPLHSAYASLLAKPPAGVSFIVPPVSRGIKNFYRFYKKYRFFSFFQPILGLVEKTFFLRSAPHDEADIYQYLNMIDQKLPDKPYIVDTEHPAGLISYVPDKKRLGKAKAFLTSQNCKAITCWSEASRRTLEKLLGGDFKHVAHKTHVVYPAPVIPTKLKADYSIIANDPSTLKLLLVGNQAYLKGAEEVLAAIKHINGNYGEDKLSLVIISNDADEVVGEYNLPNVKLYKPDYGKQEILEKFFMPADIFVLPTKQETFGMALLDALSCGTAVITTRQFATPEIVTEGSDGLLLNLDNAPMDAYTVPPKSAMDAVAKRNFNPKLAQQLTDKLVSILEAKVDIGQMGRASKTKFASNGKFSIERRNKKLLDIYERAI